MRKRIALLLAIVMILSVFPMAAHADASFTRVTGLQTVSRTATLRTVEVEVEIPERSLASGESDTLFLELPADVTGTVYIDGDSIEGFSSVVFAGGDDSWTKGSDRQEVAINVVTDDNIRDGDGVFYLSFEGFELDNFSGDEVVARFDSASGSAFGSGDVVLARVDRAGEVTVSMLDVDFITDTRGDGSRIGTMRITESTAGALDSRDDIQITLPRGFTWRDNTGDINTRYGDDVLTRRFTDTIGRDARPETLVLETSSNTNEASSWEVSGLEIVIDPTLADMGEIEASVSGATPGSLIVAIYGDYLAEVTQETLPTRLAGQTGRLGDFRITESIGSSLVAGRTITMSLPSGVKWDARAEGDFRIRTADSDNFAGFNLDWEVVDVAGRTLRASVPDGFETPLNSPLDVQFQGPHVAIEPGFEGDIEVQFGGSAGVGGEVVLAEVVKPVVGELVDPANPAQLATGFQNQTVGDFTITENVAGALERGEDIVLRPVWEGVRFATRPEVTADGDIMIEDVWTSPNGRELRITINADSDETASTITVSNLALSLDRVMPEGDLQLEIMGDAVVEPQIHREAAALETATSWLFAPYFRGSNVSSVFTVAEVDVDAVDPDTRAQVAFTVGSNIYMVDGEPMMMDVAPYISNDRIMIPVRYLETVFGMQPIWNHNARTVTVLFEGDVYGMAIGSNMITLNGADYMEMDAAAEITNDRTFVPASRFARAMGIDYEWDAMTNTATFN